MGARVSAAMSAGMAARRGASELRRVLRRMEKACFTTFLKSAGSQPRSVRSLRVSLSTPLRTLGGGREHEGLDGEQVFAVVPGLKKHGEDAAVAVARRGADALGHFLLQHAGGNRYAVAVVKDTEKYLARDIVREIAYQGHVLTGKHGVEVHLQEVGLHYVQTRVQVVQETYAFGIQLHAFQLAPGVH